jgi:hypothetical protein
MLLYILGMEDLALNMQTLLYYQLALVLRYHLIQRKRQLQLRMQGLHTYLFIRGRALDLEANLLTQQLCQLESPAK